MLRECDCEIPRPHSNPRYPNQCIGCGWYINPRWASNDQTMREFFNRLASIPGIPGFEIFRRHCEARERAGRETFGHSHLARDTAQEGCEEAVDAAIYAALSLLRARRDGHEEPTALALQAAHQAAQLHHTFRLLAAEMKTP